MSSVYVTGSVVERAVLQAIFPAELSPALTSPDDSTGASHLKGPQQPAVDKVPPFATYQ